MKLTKYIEMKGVPEFSKKTGVKVRTVQSWLYKQRRPSPDMAINIERKTRGVVSVKECYE